MSDIRQQISDGYHTFEELYEHRILLFFSLVVKSNWNACWRPHYPEWPVLLVETPAGQISYHFHEKYLPLIADHVPMNDSIVWDGHDSKQVVERLRNLLGDFPPLVAKTEKDE